MSTISTPGVSFDQLIRNKTHKVRVVGNSLHVYNSTTGATEYILKKDYTKDARTALIPHVIDGNNVLVEEDIRERPATLKLATAYSELILEIICNQLVEGKSIKEICAAPDMPSYSTLCSWKRNIPGVEDKLHQAREDRAEYLRDEAMEEILECDEDTVASASAKHKALVWAAGVDNARYSPKAKLEATLVAPTQIIVNTGIRRDDEGESGRGEQALEGASGAAQTLADRPAEQCTLDGGVESTTVATGVDAFRGGVADE